MKIYRYVPDGRQFRSMRVSYNDRFWPQGIDLGKRADQEFPRGLTKAGWWLEGNQFRSYEATQPLADFVATTMNIVTVTERAVEAIGGKKVAVTTDGAPAFAIELPRLQGVIDLDASRAVVSDGQPLFWYHYKFRPEHITADAFWLEEAMPFSYVFLTERIVEKAHASGWTGLDYVELVWDGTAAVELAYPPVTHVRQQTGYRYHLEESFVLARAAMVGQMTDEVHPILEQAMAKGRFPASYPALGNERSPGSESSDSL